MTQTQTEEEKSKDVFFEKLATLSQEMVDAHGREFSMGALVLAARFIAEDKPFDRQSAPQ